MNGDNNGMRIKHSLTNEDVRAIALACRVEIEKNDWNMTLAIVDEGGHPLYLERMDRARVSTVNVAIGKAKTAAFSRAPTHAMESRLKENPALFFLDAMPMQGGLPILHEGECVGGIGVSGGTGAQDEQVGNAGLAALKVHK